MFAARTLKCLYGRNEKRPLLLWPEERFCFPSSYILVVTGSGRRVFSSFFSPWVSRSVGRPVCTSEDSFSLSSLLLLLLLHLVAIILRTFLSPSRSSDLCCWGTQNLLINRQINSPPSSIMQFRMAQKSQPAVYEIKYRRFDFHACTIGTIGKCIWPCIRMYSYVWTSCRNTRGGFYKHPGLELSSCPGCLKNALLVRVVRPSVPPCNPTIQLNRTEEGRRQINLFN